MLSARTVRVQVAVCILMTFVTSMTGVTLAKNRGNGATDLEFNHTEFESRLDRFIRAGLKCHNNPALTISVVRQGQTVMAKGYGNVTLDDVRPVTNTTLFGIASLSKAFAATLILQLIEENPSVSLSSKVTDLLGEDVFMDRLQARYTTLQDLLAHRVGLPSNNNIRLDSTLTRTNLPGRIKYLKADTGAFRTSFMYSNLMYGLVTRIAELLGNDTWENLVQDRIFRPLGMTSSTFATTADPSTLDLVQGYQDINGKLHPVSFKFSRHWAELCGSGCVLSNALDMAIWIKFHLQNGWSEDNQKVGAKFHAAMYEPENIIKSDSTNDYYSRPFTPETLTYPNYGMGWKLGTYRGLPIISHTGSTYGYRSMLSLMRDSKLGVFVAMTGDDPSCMFRTNVHLHTLDLLLGEEPWLDQYTVCTFPEPWKQAPPITPLTLPRDDIPLARPGTDYEGVYHNDAYGQASISNLANSNKLNMVLGLGKFSLLPKSSKDNDVFAVVSEGMIQYLIYISEVRFEINGTLASFEIPYFNKNDPPVFKRTGTVRHEKLKNSMASACLHILIQTTLLMIVLILN